MGDSTAIRRMWAAAEHVHLVTYFAPEASAAYEQAGVTGFWRGYFGGRAAPMGAVAPGVVVATFYGFHPDFVARAVPDVWDRATPEALLAARLEGATAALARLLPEDTSGDGAADAAAVADQMLGALGSCATAGRPLFAALADLDVPDDPIGALWHACSLWREHRGDGHLAALVGAGLDGCESHVLRLAVAGGDANLMRFARGWSDDDWADAVDRLAQRGLLADQTVPTDEGRALVAEIEATTDRLAAEPVDALGEPGTAATLAVLEPLARAVSAGLAVPDPNPIGVPAPG